jgi:diguanylate cyclase (GGDEF)-like protein
MDSPFLTARRKEPGRILLVEDDPTLGRLLHLILSRRAPVVDVVHAGHEALAVLAHSHYDAIACDISLPDMSGMDVIAAARNAQPACGIVAITGFVDVETAVRSMKAGADDFLGKPFEPEILWHLLNKAADSRGRHLEAEQSDVYRRLAYTDALTGCPNRRFIDEFIDEAVRDAREHHTPLSVAYVDIDNFKLLNDFVGHQRGDELLRAVAKAMTEAVEKPAEFGRFGGDEFVAIFPGMVAEEAQRRIENVRRAVSRIDVRNGELVALPARISCGVAELAGEETPRALIAEAEDRMYLDKSVTPQMLSLAATTQVAPPLKVTNLKALRNLVKAIDRRDSYTRYHSDHATQLALLLGRQLGLPDAEMSALSIGGPIHDLGKIVVPDEILRKPGPLTIEERRTMEEHPVMGAAITAAVTDYDAVVSLVRHHHERVDGDGYPAGLRGTEINRPTRLFTLCDAYSAMTTDRSYRKGLSLDQAVAQIEKGRGSQFDGDLGDAFIVMVEREFGHLRRGVAA